MCTASIIINVCSTQTRLQPCFQPRSKTLHQTNNANNHCVSTHFEVGSSHRFHFQLYKYRCKEMQKCSNSAYLNMKSNIKSTVSPDFQWFLLVEGSLNSKLPTIWTVQKQSRVVKSAERRCNSSKSEEKKDTSAPNVSEVAKCCVFSMIPVSGQSKSRPVKAAGAESCGQRRNQKLHAAVAKNTFGSENAKKLTVSEHFLKFWCWKIAHGCGEKHIWK